MSDWSLVEAVSTDFIGQFCPFPGIKATIRRLFKPCFALHLIIDCTKETGKTILEYLTTFQASNYTIGDLQLFRGVNEQAVARALAACPVMRVAAGQAVADSSRKGAHLYVVLRGALGVTADQPFVQALHRQFTRTTPGNGVLPAG